MKNWVPCLLPRAQWKVVSKAEAKSPMKCPNAEYVKALEMSGLKGILLPAGEGRPLHCKQNVAAFLVENEGEPHTGRILWINPKTTEHVFETHIVVKKPDGSFLDVTSYFDGGKQIYFIP